MRARQNEAGKLVCGVNSAQFSPDGKRVVTAGADGTTRIWDVASGRNLQSLVVRVLRPVRSPDGTLVITAGDGRHRAHLGCRERQQKTILRGHSKQVTSMAFSLGGTRVVTTSADGTARVWDVGAHPAIRTLAGDTGALAWAAFIGHCDGSAAFITHCDRKEVKDV